MILFLDLIIQIWPRIFASLFKKMPFPLEEEKNKQLLLVKSLAEPCGWADGGASSVLIPLLTDGQAAYLTTEDAEELFPLQV